MDRLYKGRERPNEKRRHPGRRRLHELLEAYGPFVSHLAHRYRGRGAEPEDLRQEGYIALFELARRFSKKQYKRVVSNFLPGIVRDAAASLRHRAGTVQLSACEDSDSQDAALMPADKVEDGRSADDLEQIELMDAIERKLSGPDLTIVNELLRGFTHAEIAARLGISQQAASKRIARLRVALKDIWS
ncbi:MAG: sigma-70 family RNA polymerase sigma factor [Synergistaceae bacterium]|nr:sigma-70 family RNA polymerase sigma factor [Synergistaceae bacterium]